MLLAGEVISSVHNLCRLRSTRTSPRLHVLRSTSFDVRMKFGKQLRLSQKPTWQRFYVDYELLKRYCNEHPAVGNASSPADERSCCDGGGPAMSSAAVAIDNLIKGMSPAQAQAAFVRALASELQRADAFFHSQIQNLSQTCESTVEIVDAAAGLEPVDIRVPLAHASLRDVSQRIDDLREFSLTNREAVRKIAKKFDKRWSNEDEGLFTSASAAAQAELSVRQLISLSELVAMSELCATLAQKLPAPVSSGVREKITMPAVEPIAQTVASLDLASLPAGSFTFLRVQMGTDPVSEPISMPVMIARGRHSGPTLGITSAVHGNELNGIPVIHRLFRSLDCATLCGTILAVPVVNVHGYTRYQRGYSDGVDLNRIFPGKKQGTASQQFAAAFMSRVVRHVDLLLDLHTASFGRVNSLYVRADMNDEVGARLAKLQSPQLIVHNTGPDGSLRGAAAALGKPAITIEIGNPQSFHGSFIDRAYAGVVNTLHHLKMIPGATDGMGSVESPPVVCARSFWLFTQTGGVLYVFPAVNTWVRKGDVIAEIHSVFGSLVDRIVAPQDAIVIGKSCNPVAETGDRILHLGVVEPSFPATAHDGHA